MSTVPQPNRYTTWGSFDRTFGCAQGSAPRNRPATTRLRAQVCSEIEYGANCHPEAAGAPSELQRARCAQDAEGSPVAAPVASAANFEILRRPARISLATLAQRSGRLRMRASNRQPTTDNASISVMLEELNSPFMRLCRLARLERAEVGSLAGAGVLLSRIEPVFACFQFPDHALGSSDIRARKRPHPDGDAQRHPSGSPVKTRLNFLVGDDPW